MNLWLKHPRSGEPDTMLTLSTLSTLTVLVKFLLNDVVLNILGNTYKLGTVDAGVIAAILTPTLGAYVMRKMKDSPDDKQQ